MNAVRTFLSICAQQCTLEALADLRLGRQPQRPLRRCRRTQDLARRFDRKTSDLIQFLFCPVFSVFSVRYILKPFQLALVLRQRLNVLKIYRTENTENTGQNRNR